VIIQAAREYPALPGRHGGLQPSGLIADDWPVTAVIVVLALLAAVAMGLSWQSGIDRAMRGQTWSSKLIYRAAGREPVEMPEPDRRWPRWWAIAVIVMLVVVVGMTLTGHGLAGAVLTAVFVGVVLLAPVALFVLSRVRPGAARSVVDWLRARQ
jgi:hypothetical protein